MMQRLVCYSENYSSILLAIVTYTNLINPQFWRTEKDTVNRDVVYWGFIVLGSFAL